VGEAALVLKTDSGHLNDLLSSPCSCGETMGQCVFWRPVLARIRETGAASYEERFKILIKTFEGVFGDQKTIVDSSKYLPNLIWLNEHTDLSLKVIHVVKDVRAFTVSHIDNRKRRGKRCGFRTRFQLFLRWYLDNRRIARYVERQRIPCLTVGYEEVCLSRDFMLQKICKFLGTSLEPSMMKLEQSKSHSVLGNRMRQQDQKKQVQYDHRWFTRHEWELPSLVFPNIMKFNSRKTYSNNTENIWKS
jgi:hypothetical protein